MTKPGTGIPDTYKATELAAKLGISLDTLYESVRTRECPVQPIRVGRRMVWAKARVDELLGAGASE